MVPRMRPGPPGNPGRAIMARIIWLTLLGARLGIALLWTGVPYRVVRPSAAALDDYGPAPRFQLTDQLGRSVSSDELAGKVVLVDFIYTSCTDICPLLSDQMREVQERLRGANLLGERAQLLSITVDPARDTPEVLQAYAQRFRADPAAWRFVTGTESEVMPVIEQGFHLGVQRIPLSPISDGDPFTADRYEIVHSGRLTLVDREGHIRAYYDTRDVDVDRVVRAIRALT